MTTSSNKTQLNAVTAHKSQSFDIVLVTSYKDIPFLRRTLPFIQDNIGPSKTIFIVTDCLTIRRNRHGFPSSPQIHFVDEDSLVPGMTLCNVADELSKRGRTRGAGWYFQQFLKMGFSLAPYASGKYLFWDADTIPLHPIRFFENDKFLFNPKKEHHPAYFSTIRNLLHIDDAPPFSFIAEHFMVDTSIMREMIAEIEQDNPESWWRAILDKADLRDSNAFSEMETYGNYCRIRHPGLYVPRKLDSFRAAGLLFGRQVSQKELKLLALDFDIVSFERRHHPKGVRGLCSRLSRIWIELSHRIGVSFLSNMESPT